MKRLGVAGIIMSEGNNSIHLLMGRRDKDPNRGLYVLPGGGVQDGETLEEAFRREIMEETGLEIYDNSTRWQYPYVVELEDRIILVSKALVKYKDDVYNAPRDGSDLYDVKWFEFNQLPTDISPVVNLILQEFNIY